MEEGIPIEHGMVTKSIERAQKQVEAQNFAIRKHLLEYDDVMNKQRDAVYDMRRMILEGKNTREHVLSLVDDDPRLVRRELLPGEGRPSAVGLREPAGCPQGDLRPRDRASRTCAQLGRGELVRGSRARAHARYEEKERQIGPELVLFHQRMLMLQIVDTQWKDHLYSLDHLKEGIGLRGYGQRDPLVEYKKESYEMFQALMDRIDEEILRWIFLYQPMAPPVDDRTGTSRRSRRTPGPDPRPRARRAGPRAGARHGRA